MTEGVCVTPFPKVVREEHSTNKRKTGWLGPPTLYRDEALNSNTHYTLGFYTSTHTTQHFSMFEILLCQGQGPLHIIFTLSTVNWPEHWTAQSGWPHTSPWQRPPADRRPVSGPLVSTLRESTLTSHVLSHTDTERGVQGRWHLCYKTTTQNRFDKQTLWFLGKKVLLSVELVKPLKKAFHLWVQAGVECLSAGSEVTAIRCLWV